MPWNKTHTKASPGKPISASAYNEMADTCDKMSRLSVVSPLELLKTPGGALIRLAMNLDFDIGVTSSTITAMDISTLTPGTGTVSLYTWNGDVPAQQMGTDTDVDGVLDRLHERRHPIRHDGHHRQGRR